MKKIIVISDSFKGTLSSAEICEIARQSVPRVLPGCELAAIPVADGGEGTVDCFIHTAGASPVAVNVAGPYGETVRAVYARIGNKAVIEMVCAAGLTLTERHDPELATTFGVGEIIRHAAEHGCDEILLGLGGSGTNDCGCGCAAALGVKFYGPEGMEFVPPGRDLGRVARIDVSAARELLKGVRLTVMCDVDNPLCGPAGAAHVFAPQKGADEAMVLRLDAGLRSLSEVIRRELGLSVADMAGAGAAGGMGAGCAAFLGAELKPGIEAILDLVDFDRHLKDAELVITGEGRIDAQSVHGKVISGVAKRTASRGVPLIAIVGGIDDSADEAYAQGVTAMFGIDRGAEAFEACAHKAADNYRRTLEDVLRLVRRLTRNSR